MGRHKVAWTDGGFAMVMCDGAYTDLVLAVGEPDMPCPRCGKVLHLYWGVRVVSAAPPEGGTG